MQIYNGHMGVRGKWCNLRIIDSSVSAVCRAVHFLLLCVRQAQQELCRKWLHFVLFCFFHIMQIATDIKEEQL